MASLCLTTTVITLLLISVVSGEFEEIKVKDHCGYSKGCLMAPDNCEKMEDCEYLLTFRDNGSYIDFEMSGKVSIPGWVAFGLSHDQNMGEDSVTECVSPGLGNIAVYNSFNNFSKDGDNSNFRLQRPSEGIIGVEGVYEHGILRCKFSKLKTVDNTNALYDLNKKWYLLMARGAADLEGRKFSHSHNERPLHSKTKADLRSHGPIEGNQCSYNLLIRIHGVLMVIAWIGCISCGILIARYFKFTWPHTTIAGEAVWFQLHRFLQIIAVLCIFVAVVLIFVAIGGWIENDSSLAHALCGIIAASFAVMQPFMALCRCHPGTKNRPIFNWLHWFLGSVAHILAIVALFLAVDIPKTCLKPYVDYILIAFVIFHVIVEILLEIHACCYRDSKADAKELMTKNYGQFMPEREREEIHGSVFQQCVLAVYGLVVFGIVMALVVIILIT